MKVKFIFNFGISFLTCLLLLQSCGTLEKRRYSNGWNWNLELQGNTKNEEELKAKKAQKIGCIAMKMDLVVVALDTEVKSPVLFPEVVINNVSNDKNPKIHSSLKQIFSDTIPFHSKINREEIKQYGLRKDKLGMTAFYICLSMILLLIICTFSPLLLEPLLTIAIMLNLLSMIVLFIRQYTFRNGRKALYVEKGYGTVAWVITAIAALVASIFFWIVVIIILTP